MSLLDKILGRALKTSEAQGETIGPIAGVAVLGLDGLSSAGYGPEAAIAVLMAAGAAGLPSVGPILAGIIGLLAIVLTLAATVAIGIFKSVQSGGHPAPVIPPTEMPAPTMTVGVWLIVRAFASGCTAMTGVEAVSNGVPLFSEPRTRKAHVTLAIIVIVLAVLLVGIGYVAHAYQIGVLDQNDARYQSVISQMVAAVMGRGVFYYVTLFSVLIVLTISANTSFAGFPRLCRLLADDGFLPIAFANLGRRLVYTVGIIVLAVLSAILLIAFDGVTDRLIPLFAVGAFAAFTLSQAGMVIHWRKQKGNFAAQSVNALGAVSTGAALVVIILAKFTEGAWVSVLAIGALYLLFLGVQRHYQRVLEEIADDGGLQMAAAEPVLVIVPMGGWNKVTKRALRFAQEISPDVLALHIRADREDNSLVKRWGECVEAPARAAGLTPPRLEVVNSEYRKLVMPILNFVGKVQHALPGKLIAVVIPELVQPRWYESILHNHHAAILKALLLMNGNNRVIVINVPWYLHGSEKDLAKA